MAEAFSSPGRDSTMGLIITSIIPPPIEFRITAMIRPLYGDASKLGNIPMQTKTMGDLLGPCTFAVLMGLSRTYFGTRGSKLKLRKALILSSILCVASYMLVVFSPIPLLSLIGCGLVGLSVGIFWPGTLSLSVKVYPSGGTAMFAVLALAGDLGCSFGPGLVGLISNRVQNNGSFSFLSSLISGADYTQVGLKTGLLMAIIFPIFMILGIVVLGSHHKN
jgi:MFS family permease